ncbi:MAG: lysophospholipase [Lachnospiraceae bacterium]|nr:lysophospholipase [Lachnospiraceae bacterium]
MIVKDFCFASASGLCDIHARSMTPDEGEPKAVVQITHGMAEHKERYMWLAERLTEAGYAVYFMDLLGHGESVASEDDLGYFGDDGVNSLLKDMRELNEIGHSELPGLPYVMFGHSMGSFLTRAYTAKYPSTFDAAVYCGTSGPNGAAKIGLMMAKSAEKKDPHDRPAKLNNMAFGSYNKRTENRTPVDWLSRETGNVDAYVEDPLCGFCFTSNGFVTLMTVLISVSGSDWAAKVPNVPIYLIAGGEDPVGQYGKGVEKVRKMLEKTGHTKVAMKLYPGDRHEIFNEVDKEQVTADLIAWLGQLA